MKRRISLLLAIAILICTFGSDAMKVQACELCSSEEPSYFNELTRIRATVYCDWGPTKSGEWVREGIVAMNKDLLGKTALLYDERTDELIGIYDILDTGSHPGLKNGTRVDVYCPTLAACNEWVKEHGDYVYILIVDIPG